MLALIDRTAHRLVKEVLSFIDGIVHMEKAPRCIIDIVLVKRIVQVFSHQ
jgi:hypothetical protein